MGARAQGMGHASACLYDVWALNNNVAGLAKTTSPGAGVSYHAIPTFPPFNRMSAVASVPLGWGVAGASLFRFGDDLYSEQIVSLGFANSFGLASLGLKVNYLQYRAEGLDTRGALSVSFGGIAHLTEQLSFGAHVINLNQPVINAQTGDRLPTLLTTGLTVQLSPNVIAAAEIEKDIDRSPTMKAGFEYQVLKKIALRGGFNIHPQSGFVGIGARAKKFDVGYTLEMNRLFGASHQASITFNASGS